MPRAAEQRDGDVPAVRLRRIVKNYGQRTALRGVDLEIAGPQIVGAT